MLRDAGTGAEAHHAVDFMATADAEPLRQDRHQRVSIDLGPARVAPAVAAPHRGTSSPPPSLPPSRGREIRGAGTVVVTGTVKGKPLPKKTRDARMIIREQSATSAEIELYTASRMHRDGHVREHSPRDREAAVC